MRTLLFELGVEELPAGIVRPAMNQLVQRLTAALEEARLAFVAAHGYATPRRLAAAVTGVAELQAPRQTRVRGPSKAVAFDPQGRPTQAAIGFARAQGVSVDSLVIDRFGESEYVFAVKSEPSRPAAAILPGLLAEVVQGMQFARTMRWKQGELRFPRPIRWVVALFGDEVVPVQLDGLAAGRESFGHRLAHPGPVRLESADDYEAALLAAGVVVDPQRRWQMVVEEVRAAAHRNAGRPVEQEELLEEITHLVEYPVGLVGRFDSRFLSLPREVLLTVMASHQRYVAVVDDEGALKPVFVVVANGDHIDLDLVRQGNERVLAARLADAWFFYEEDLKKPLADRVGALRGVTFQERLGSMYDKTLRVAELVSWFASRLELPASVQAVARRAAQLCKADLVTHMVYEFPELQGVMGREYASRSGEPAEVAAAIGEHYRPRFSGDRLPESEAGALVALADKLDTIVGFFGIGQGPTGSEDPFALRRHALGVVRISLERGWAWPISEAVAAAAELYGERLRGQGRESREEGPNRRPPTDGHKEGQAWRSLSEEVSEFLRQRLRAVLAEEGLDPASVEAALRAAGDSLVEAARRARALAALRGGQEFEDAIVAFQRAYNLARGRPGLGQVDEAMLLEPMERALWQALQETVPAARSALQAGDVQQAVRQLARLRPTVDRFFEQVLVMAEDGRLRANRLELLHRLVGAFQEVADFSALAS